MKRITWLQPGDPPTAFPPVSRALDEPPGLLAAGGDLTPERLVAAYGRGIFPWYSPGEPVMWWSPDPREVLFPAELHVSRSLRRVLLRGQFTVTENQDFSAVIAGCATARDPATGTWITAEMRAAYMELHRRGMAASIEVWSGSELAGGLYGVRSGQVFSGESMFSRRDNASKVALEWLSRRCIERGIALIDCQMPSAHLRSMGSRPIPRSEFLRYLPAGAVI
ncbi:MAG TPA: leucyl/phenylalanyl-tRNA--protein transferase [Steroidobacteraceae bacterium]|nr:leucyl/phenylalanyl-tRNA--protein transferase [Steroidobacteraceae bacterium]